LSETDEDEALETEDTQFVVTSDSVKTLSAEKDFNIYMRVLRMSKDESYLIFCAVLSAAIGGAVLPLFGFLMAEQMDSMLSETNDETMKRRCARYSLWMLVLSFVILIAFAITGFFQSLAGASLTTKIRKKSFRALLYHDMAYFDQ
jgi:ABC-type multidrug transport system fused ATPase/permease subunit